MAHPGDELFDVPPAQFTAARNALVKQLRGSGKTDQAKQVAALHKPTPVVWALNHLARTDAATIRALLEATDALRHAQHGTADEMRDRMQAHKEALAALADAGNRALTAAGLKSSQAIERRILDTAQGAALAAREQLREGTLEHELPAPGFAALLGTPLAPAPKLKPVPAPRARHDEVAERRRRAEAEKAERAARLEHERAVHAAEVEAKRLDERAAKAEQVAAHAREALERADAAARDARAAANHAARHAEALRGRGSRG